MNTEQKRRFRNYFKIGNTNLDRDSKLLYSVITLDANSCDEEYEITYKDFIDYFYVNIKAIDEKLVALKNNIRAGKKYHYIHSYGKNGKTTFNRRFKEENKEEYQFIILDFKDFQIDPDGQKHSLMTKTVKEFEKLNSVFGETLATVIGECLTHIMDTKQPIEITSTAELRSEYNSLFRSITPHFINFLTALEEDASDHPGNDKKALFDLRFQPFVSRIIEEHPINEIEIFNLLLLVYLKLFSTQEKPIIFIFDNLDDILTHASEYLTAEIIPKVDVFLTILKKYLNRKKEFINDDVLDQTYFIFTYRTANYVSSMFSVSKNVSAANRREELLCAPLYIFSSVNFTTDILRKKLNFYTVLCEEFNITPSPNCAVFYSILEAFENEENEFKHIAKLWNGNQFAFIKCLQSLTFSDLDHTSYLRPSTRENARENHDVMITLKRGLFLFYVVKNYYSGKEPRFIRDSSLAAAFQYAFTNDEMTTQNAMCNLLRLFLTYIINHNRKLNRRLQIVENNKDIFTKGVGLKKVLDALTQFKRDGEIIYNREKLKEMFTRIFHEDIDSFDYFITCVKDTDIVNGGGALKLGKKYELQNEVDIYFDHPEDRDSLDSIRLYYNTNSIYFLGGIKRHFEFFSALADAEHPLFYKIKIFQCVKEDLNYDGFIFSYDFNNNTILKEVFHKTKQTLNNTVQFYLDTVINHFGPSEYCQISNLALDGVFLYDDLISKHITYIEKVRQGIMNGTVPIKVQVPNSTDYALVDIFKIDTEIRANINGRFIYWIEQYIDLFSRYFDDIKAAAQQKGYEMDSHSIATRRSFSLLRTKINHIKSSNYADFTTKIESK